MSDIIFSISGDTANGLVEPTTLYGEIITSGLAPALKVETLGDVLTINHTPSLGSPDWAILVGVVAAHTGIDFSTVAAPASAQTPAYTVTSGITDRSFNADATTLDELADILGTLITDLQTKGLIG